MSTRILPLGFDPPPSAVPGADLVLTPPEDGGLRAGLDLVRRHTAAGDTLLGLHPAWQRDPWAHDLALLRVAAEAPQVVPVPLDLPPLAGSVLAGLLALLGADHEPAETLAAIGPLCSTTKVMAVLGTLAGLEHVPVSVGEHLISLVPGTVHLVVTGAHGRVVRVRRRRLQLPLPGPSPHLGLLVAAGRRGDDESVRQTLAATGWAPRTATVEPTTLGPRWWGTDRLVEVVLYPTHEARVHGAMRHLPAVITCSWCDRRTPRLPCVFCGATPSSEVAS